MPASGQPQPGPESTLLRIGRSPGFDFLPAYVLEHERLVEKCVQELGLAGVTVEHGEFSGGNVMNGALLAGDLASATPVRRSRPSPAR